MDKVAMSISNDSQAETCVKQLRRDATWLDRQVHDNQQELAHIMKIVATREKEAVPQEAEALQTYLVGNKQIMEEKEQAPCGRRKARVVGCGNFGTPDETVTTSTGGTDAVALRVLMMVASQRGWACGSTGVNSAFLQAPKRSAAHRVTLVKPPQLVAQLGQKEPCMA